MQQIAARETELKAITNRLFSVSSVSTEGQLRELRQFVNKGIANLCSLLNHDTSLAKVELQKHLSEIRMTPTGDEESGTTLRKRRGIFWELARMRQF